LLESNEGYKVLANKYRPKIFSDIIGQRSAVNLLQNMVANNKYPPSILLAGSHSSGKTTLARILSRRANCLKPKGVDPCGKCSSCKLTNHPDILEINAADNRGIDIIRQLSDISRLYPTFKRRTFILDEYTYFSKTKYIHRNKRNCPK